MYVCEECGKWAAFLLTLPFLSSLLFPIVSRQTFEAKAKDVSQINVTQPSLTVFSAMSTGHNWHIEHMAATLEKL